MPRASPSVERRRACRCGTTRHDRFAIPEAEYSLLGNLYAAWGGTAIPTRGEFRCVKCNAWFDASTDPEVCRAHK